MSEMEINLVNGTLVLVTLWLLQELRLASKDGIRISRFLEKVTKTMPTLSFSSLLYVYSSNVRNQQCNRWFEILSPAH